MERPGKKEKKMEEEGTSEDRRLQYKKLRKEHKKRLRMRQREEKGKEAERIVVRTKDGRRKEVSFVRREKARRIVADEKPRKVEANK